MLDFSTIDDVYQEYENIYNDILDISKKILKIKANLLVSVSLIDNLTIHKINKEYRNIDKETDVISFAFLDNEDRSILFKKGDVVLGDIYISIEKANSQAKEYGNSIKREMMFLFVHGLLHLCGYDHMVKEDEEIMFPLQEKIIKGYLNGN